MMSNVNEIFLWLHTQTIAAARFDDVTKEKLLAQRAVELCGHVCYLM
jgi:hypothetical protein